MSDLQARSKALASVAQAGPDTLITRITHFARELGEIEAMRFLTSAQPDTVLSFDDLHRCAGQMAAHLATQGVSTGDRVALICAEPLDFTLGFLGCLWAGVQAVPLPRPRVGAAADRLLAVLSDCDCHAVLGDADTLADLDLAPEITRIPIDRTAWENLAPVPACSPPPDAFLQYTSGSTGRPKGVRISHANLAAVREAITRATQIGPEDIVVSWLPLEHDMGLIGGLLHPLWMGARGVFFSADRFVTRPKLWLDAISRYRATVTVAPDFAYALCARMIRAKSRVDLDLSSLQVAMSGAEPVRIETIDAFCDAFAESGFQRRAFLPCYGLAEATLLVTGAGRQDLPQLLTVDKTALEQGQLRPAETGRVLVSLGASRTEVPLRIVDPETGTPCPEGHVGEIWIAGPSVSNGYFGIDHPDFHGSLPDTPARFLRSGDLGAMLNGELFVTGRLKARIIRNGRTLHASDLELAVDLNSRAVRDGRLMVVQLQEDGAIIALQEISSHRASEPEQRSLAQAIWRQIHADSALAIDRVMLAAPGSLLWTTSGKPRRAASLDHLKQAPDRVLLDWVPDFGLPQAAALTELLRAKSNADQVENTLCAWLAAVTGTAPEEIDPDLPWSDQAVDSLMAATLLAELEPVLGDLAQEDLMFSLPTPADLAMFLVEVA